MCHFQQYPTRASLLDSPCCTAAKHAQCLPTDVVEDDLESNVIVGNLLHSTWWGALCHTFPLTLSPPQFLPDKGCPLAMGMSSCKETVPTESWPPKVSFLSSVLWTALLDSPVGGLLCDIQLICPQTIPWKWLGRFVLHLLCFFTFASHRPYSGKALKPWCASVYLLLFLGQLGTSAGKPNSKHRMFIGSLGSSCFS